MTTILENNITIDKILNAKTEFKYNIVNNNEETNFGLLTIKSHENDSILSLNDYSKRKRVIFYISADKSGSMDERATNRNNSLSKLEYVKRTLIKLVEYLIQQTREKPYHEFYISINIFDSKVFNVSKFCKITETTFLNIIERIESISCGDNTNFEDPLLEVNKQICNESIMINNIINIENIEKNGCNCTLIEDDLCEEQISRIHMFLTDGDNNTGNQNLNYLTNLLYINYSELDKNKKQPQHIFIGYGPDHNNQILNHFTKSCINGKQYFIDNIEHTGFVIGEILWFSLSVLLNNISITITNGQIYDTNSNKWCQTINTGIIPYDMTRTFHIKGFWHHENVDITLDYNIKKINCDNSCSINNSTYIMICKHYTKNENNELLINDNVEKEEWRYNTIITLNECMNYLQNKNRIVYDNPREEFHKILQKTKDFYVNLTNYINDKNLQNDIFMRQLSDDIYVAICGIKSSIQGLKYIQARHLSQTEQRATTISDVSSLHHSNDDAILPPNSSLKINKQNKTRLFSNISLMNDSFTPYMTPQCNKIGRSLSNINNNNKNNENHENENDKNDKNEIQDENIENTIINNNFEDDEICSINNPDQLSIKTPKIRKRPSSIY